MKTAVYWLFNIKRITIFIKFSETLIISIMNSYSILLIAAIICHSYAKNPNIRYPNCVNIKGEAVMEGDDFVPADNDCVHCMCFKSQGKFCGSLRCDEPPPLGCKKWTEVCCNYTCYDNEYNEMDDVDLSHMYDPPETSSFDQLKKYAGKLWNSVRYGKKVPAKNDIPVFKNKSNEQMVTAVDDQQSTSVADYIPEDISLPSPSAISKEVLTTEKVHDEVPTLHNARNCLDSYDIEVEEGQFFVHGPDKCYVCRCINGRARFCTTMDCNDDVHPPEDCDNWTKHCCEYTCNDTKDPKANFFINRWFDNWFRKTTLPPPTNPIHTDP